MKHRGKLERLKSALDHEFCTSSHREFAAHETEAQHILPFVREWKILKFLILMKLHGSLGQ